MAHPMEGIKGWARERGGADPPLLRAEGGRTTTMAIGSGEAKICRVGGPRARKKSAD